MTQGGREPVPVSHPVGELDATRRAQAGDSGAARTCGATGGGETSQSVTGVTERKR